MKTIFYIVVCVPGWKKLTYWSIQGSFYDDLDQLRSMTGEDLAEVTSDVGLVALKEGPSETILCRRWKT